MYRLLNKGEEILPTDEYFSSYYWRKWGYHDIKTCWSENYAPVRRAVSVDGDNKFSALESSHSPKFPTYDEVVASVESDQNDCFKLTQDHYSGMRRCYDYILRQLQADIVDSPRVWTDSEVRNANLAEGY